MEFWGGWAFVAGGGGLNFGGAQGGGGLGVLVGASEAS